ncbi:hypothetical protein D3C85_869440 [compost metagenome]
MGPGLHAGGGAVSRPGGQIADDKDAVIGGRAVVLADQNSARDRQTRRLGHFGRGNDADADNDQVGLNGRAVVQPRQNGTVGGVFQRLQRPSQLDLNADAGVGGGQPFCGLGGDVAAQQPLARLDHRSGQAETA